jgi:NAD(P)-dependent dehydrogenase (short-subunit alcohol dehydrogenase family)
VFHDDASPADAFLADVATSAITLVGGPGRDRLRRCAAPWLLPLVRGVPAPPDLVLAELRQPGPAGPVPAAPPARAAAGTGLPRAGAYSVSKAGMDMPTRHLAPSWPVPA